MPDWGNLEEVKEQVDKSESTVSIDKIKDKSPEKPPEKVEESPVETPANEKPSEPVDKTPDKVQEQKVEETPPAEPPVEVPPAEEPPVEPLAEPPATIKIGEEEVSVDQVRDLLDKQNARIKEMNEKLTLVEQIEGDEALKGMIEHYQNGGDLTDYLRSRVDYSKTPDLDFIKEDFNARYDGLGLDEGLKAEMFKKHLAEKYKLDPDGEFEFSETDVKIGEAELKRDAKVLRDAKIAEAAKFQIAKKPEVEAPTEPGQEVDLGAVREAVEKQPETQSLINSKMLKVGDSNFELKTDPSEMVEMTVDGNKFFQTFLNEDGKVDYGAWYETVAFAKERESFKNFLINQGRMLEREAQLQEAKKLSPEPPEVEKGELSEKEGLRKAMLEKGKWVTGHRL